MEQEHPGAIIRRQLLDDCDLSQAQLADRLGYGKQAICLLVNGKKSITPRMALALEREFPQLGEAELWLSIQAAYDLQEELEKQGRDKA